MTDKDKVVSINLFKERKAQEIVEFVLNCEEWKAVEYLSLAYIEYVKMGKPELGDQLVEHGVNMRAEKLRMLVKKRIDQLRSDNETSSD